MDDLRQFLRSRRRAVLVTTRPSGGLQSSPVAVAAGERGTILVTSTEQAAKVRNLRRDPAASLCLLSDDWYGPWMHVDGLATVHSMPEALPLLLAYRRALGLDDVATETLLAEHAHRVVVEIAVRRVTATHGSTH